MRKVRLLVTLLPVCRLPRGRPSAANSGSVDDCVGWAKLRRHALLFHAGI